LSFTGSGSYRYDYTAPEATTTATASFHWDVKFPRLIFFAGKLKGASSGEAGGGEASTSGTPFGGAWKVDVTNGSGEECARTSAATSRRTSGTTGPMATASGADPAGRELTAAAGGARAQTSISTPGLSSPCGSTAALAPRSAAANGAGRWRSYHGR
jgi:hypothetical protein